MHTGGEALRTKPPAIPGLGQTKPELMQFSSTAFWRPWEGPFEVEKYEEIPRHRILKMELAVGEQLEPITEAPYLPSLQRAFENELATAIEGFEGKHKVREREKYYTELHTEIDKAVMKQQHVLGCPADLNDTQNFWTTLSAAVEEGILREIGLGEDYERLAKGRGKG